MKTDRTYIDPHTPSPYHPRRAPLAIRAADAVLDAFAIAILTTFRPVFRAAGRAIGYTEGHAARRKAARIQAGHLTHLLR